jgi:selenocysteine-specific elongation factor
LKDKNVNRSHLKTNSCFSAGQIDEFLAEAGGIVRSGDTLVEKGRLDKYLEPARQILEDDHKVRPWARGIVIGELSKKLKIPVSDVENVVSYLLTSGLIALDNGLLKLKDHKPYLKPEQERLVAKLNSILSAGPLASPLKEKFITEDPAYEIVINFLKDKDELVELKNGVLLTSRDFKDILEKVITLFKSEHKVTASQVKDFLKTTRKYAIPLLEKLDELGITKRDGDYRILGENL